MMVHALMWPFCYSSVSSTLYLLLTTGCFINIIFTHQKYTDVETQTFNIVTYQCLDCSSLIPKGKMPMCVYKNILNIKLGWKSTGPSKHRSEQGCTVQMYRALGQLSCWWTRNGPETKIQAQLSSLSQPGSHGALWWYQMILHIWQQRYVRCPLTATFCSQTT